MTKVLLVEDDPIIYRMYQKAFKMEGYTTELAKNGVEGLDILKTFKPDVILLDIMMPKMNGVEMLSILRSESATKDIPVVVLTNVADAGVTHEVFTKGANMIIEKSETEPDQVLDWINSVLTKAKKSDGSDPLQEPQVLE
jgi:CheY-like chemotaxis protein